MGDGATSEEDAPGTVRPGTLTALLHEIAEAPAASLGEGWDLVLHPGAVVGRFELVRELGRGGFGVVWEAKDRELGRSVALKAVRAGGRTAVREERLLREAEAAARLAHPNIVTLFDVGRVEAGPYLVLELLRGETLEARLARGPLPAGDAVRLAVQIASGVAHAHAEGVVHRDLKPANVFLCDDGRVKVLDFGLAHAFGRRRQDGGTSGYMAPEQIEGAPEDERTDVWALGAIAFEMLTGKRPFEDDAALRRAPPTLEVPGLPALGALVARMLATRPVDRPRDGGEVLRALTAMPDVPEVAATSPRQVKMRRTRGGPRLLLVGAALCVAAATAWWALRPAPPAAAPSEPVTLAVLPLENLSGDPTQEFFSDGMTEEIIGKLSRLQGLAVTPRSSVAKYKGSHKDAREVGRELGVAYLLDGSIRRAGDRIRVSATLVKTADAFQVWSERIDARLDDVFEVQERVATSIVEALHVRLSPDEASSLARWGTRNAAAYDEYLRGQALVEHFHVLEKLEAARGHFERALKIDPSFAPAMAGLASAEAETYRNIDSRPEHLARARALLDSALAIDPRLPRALFTSGEIRGASYDYRGAAEDFRRVTALEPRNYQAWDYLCWALGYVTPPEVSEAERACRRAIAINPGYAESYYHLARVLIPQRRLAEAEQALDHLAEHFPGTYLVAFGRFWLHLGAGRPRDALAALHAEPASSTGLDLACKAMALAQMGQLDRAFAALDAALAKGYRDVPDLRASSYFEPLRRDRRFDALLARHGIATETGAAVARSRGAPAQPVPSIAVLPFADLSPGKDQEYFADGVAEEILNSLARVRGLKVVGRTSSFSFKGRRDDLKAIGRKLGAAAVLEGSVRTDGGRIRVTAQLVNAEDGFRLWSESYDREPTGVFAVQDEIARAVVDRLAPMLGPPAGAPRARAAVSPAAYARYLVGRHLERGATEDTARRAARAFEDAIALEPGYAAAWAGLSSARYLLSQFVRGEALALMEQALAAAERAVALAPEEAAGYEARAHARLGLWRWAGAREDAERALALDPGSAVAHRRYSLVSRLVSGKASPGLEHLEEAMALDPLSAHGWHQVGVARRLLGQREAAREALRNALEIDPEHAGAISEMAVVELQDRHFEEARAWLVARRGKTSPYWTAILEHALGHEATARDALADAVSAYAESDPMSLAEIHAFRGERDRAFEYLDRAFARRDPALRYLRVSSPLEALHADPRWRALLQKMNFPAG